MNQLLMTSDEMIKLASRGKAHAEQARSEYFKGAVDGGDTEKIDNADVLANVSIAESLAVLVQLAIERGGGG